VTLDRKQIGAIALAATALIVVVVLVVRARCSRSGLSLTESTTAADWCAPGFEPFAGGCFAAAEGSQGLIIYLHGRYTPETVNEEIDRQARVVRMATARGFSVVAFRGKQGGCPGPELESYWCWPSNEHTQDAGPETVASWEGALAAAEKDAGKGARYILGFSNGGYFAALIATRALLPVDAIAIVGGGAVEPTRALGPKPPVLLVAGDDDGALDSMLLLETELEREAWPHAFVAREGTHALTDFDVDMALTFFTRTRREKLPFNPPLSTRRPSPHRDGPTDDVIAPEPIADEPTVDEPNTEEE